MIKLQLKSDYDSCSFDELSVDEQQLVENAREATNNSYSPYSKFRVGAAVLLNNGKVVIGANQENAAFPRGSVLSAPPCLRLRLTSPISLSGCWPLRQPMLRACVLPLCLLVALAVRSSFRWSRVITSL